MIGSIITTLKNLTEVHMTKEDKDVYLNAKIPLFFCFGYLLYILIANANVRGKSFTRKKISMLTFFMVIHNLGLSAYSFFTFNKLYGIVKKFIDAKGIEYFISDPEKTIFREVHPIIISFYISKYYEVLDTVILHLNRKQCSFLQGYHHIGIIIAMYLNVASQQHVAYIVVLLNAFVHSIMYIYYAASSIGIRLWFKKYITSLQILQFVCGEFLYVYHVFRGDVFVKNNERLKMLQICSGVFNLAYVALLLVLFNKFFEKTYKKRKTLDMMGDTITQKHN